MKKFIVWLIVAAFVLSALSAAVLSQSPLGAIMTTPPSPVVSDAERQAELARRRSEVARALPDNAVLILFSATPRNYAGDVDFQYRQENGLYYLTNLKQPNATLVIVKNGTSVSEAVYIPKRDPRREAWEGRMYSEADASRISGISTILNAANISEMISALGEKRAYALTDGVSIAADAALFMQTSASPMDPMAAEFTYENSLAKGAFSKREVTNVRPIIDRMRMIKSPYELKMLQHAIDITTEAMTRSMAMAGRAKWEYQVQAEVEYTFRRRNADYWGYPSIVGCGPNATTLHYVESQSPITQGQLLLMDVGAEYDHYTADVTRTFPVSGKFTKEQADIYRIVYDAQEAVAKKTKPGVKFSELSKTANDVIAKGLLELGLITHESQSRLWFIHGLGHWLGMNVHDVGSYDTPLAAGMVFTNEPGIYIRADALDNLPKTAETQALIAKIKPAFERYKNIGVRIEDDMLVTPTGVTWMTAKLPRKLEDIENFMGKAPAMFEYQAVQPFQRSLFAANTFH